MSAIDRVLVCDPRSEGEWAVHDPNREHIRPRGLVGFISRRGELFEVVRVGHPFERSWFSSRDDALAVFAAPLAEIVTPIAPVARLVPEHRSDHDLRATA